MPPQESLSKILLLIILGFCLGQGHGNPMEGNQGSRCGAEPLNRNPFGIFTLLSRIVGGKEAARGSHAWMASLRKQGRHFCGATIVSEVWVLTAAHCVADSSTKFFSTVVVGCHDVSQREEGEQAFRIKSIIIHPEFDRRKPINYDIALIELEKEIIFGPSVQPACLPALDEVFEPGLVCSVYGWGRTTENGFLPSRLQEVDLPIIAPEECRHVMSSLRGPFQCKTIICAGFPAGGKDACQGDSGGPFICRRSHGAPVLVGVVSWGLGCARSWESNLFKMPEYRGSPGIFTNISELISWIYCGINKDATYKKATMSCSVQDGPLLNNEGVLDFPGIQNQLYENNELCIWTIEVSDEMQILLNFSRMDTEFDVSCTLDFVAVYIAEHLVGKYCGDVRPLPILVSSSKVQLKFVSDFRERRSGFTLHFTAVPYNRVPDSGCGSTSVLFEEGEIQSMNYPNAYNNLASCHWVIYAPKHYIVKLTFQDFNLEQCKICGCDAIRVFSDLVEEDKLMVTLCGSEVPPPVMSTSNLMHITFSTDDSEVYKGFRATYVFINTADLNLPIPLKIAEPLQERQHVRMNFDDICGVSSFPPRFPSHQLVEGEEAEPYSWPWQVSLQIADSHICGGTIIKKDWIVTAAHCFNYREQFRDLLVVVAGAHDISGRTEREHHQKRLVKEIIPHPKYNKGSKDYDIALLLLAEPFHLDHYVLPICLPDSGNIVPPSTVCVHTGWNANHEVPAISAKLHQSAIPILNQDACIDIYKYHPGSITKRMVCGGFAEGKGRDTCTGDVGGPLVCLQEDTSEFILYGIASWSICGKEYPGVYTSVTSCIDWVNHYTNTTTLKKSLISDETRVS
ncbi:ovochymase-2 isoform X2 [Pleurodeles waltl]|uniref:ovochymase-2 isoform X2 n=1 Tax=Pleurodeles waltl TaxID=8319 RepID=UPI003709708C